MRPRLTAAQDPERFVKDRPTTPATIVRPKASQRKGRSANVARIARAPTQERSQRRFGEILEAAQALLESARIEDISFYDIAKKAGMSPASVHYLFPSMAAVRLELNRRNNRDVVAFINELATELAKRGEPSWQQWVRSLADGARHLVNGSRAASEILLGPILNREGRLSNVESNIVVARSVVETLRAVFIMPDIPNLELKFGFGMEVFDAFWSRSYALHGRIDDEAFEESICAVLAYLRTVLPEMLTLRAPAVQQEQKS
ncbi:MAG: TetR/AcrR family transcriptional regulator [Nevskiaceae bacterium]|nr:MAG: TetR/AcrR family transcriptional regulator [Nevskiaceae bacterium]